MMMTMIMMMMTTMMMMQHTESGWYVSETIVLSRQGNYLLTMSCNSLKGQCPD